MVFSSYLFVLIFLPVTLLLYFGLSKAESPKYQKVFLIFASLFFYGFYNPKYLPIIIISIAVNYYAAGKILANTGNAKKIWFIAGVVFNVALLGYFKYRNFFIDSINTVFKTGFAAKSLLLPLGISFFTFQQLVFLVSAEQGRETAVNLPDYSLFVLFFPQLVSGPIVLYGEMTLQFNDSSRRYFNKDNLAKGIYIFTIGLFKKAVIADSFALLADNGFSCTELGLIPAWVTSLSYTIQIYFDFSGYSDMAVGIGKMFNYDIPANFDSPYLSESITSFWRRWHITLGRALSTCVYIPLGGNRKGITRTCINLLLTFAVSGIWHGAAWTFVVWGVMHGVFTVIERIHGNTIQKINKTVRIILTFLIVNALWVLFRAESFDKAIMVYGGMLSFANLNLPQLQDIVLNGYLNYPAAVDYVYIIAMLALAFYLIFKHKNSTALYNSFRANTRSSICTAVMLSVSLIYMSRESIFIYFNF